MAEVDNSLRLWSSTASNNKPTGATSIGTGLDDNIRQVQATVRQYLASIGSTIASAATVDLSTADGKTIPVSGTSTVTGLGTEVAGLEYMLTTTGAQVWKHSSALTLPGAADITTAAGDYLLAHSKGAGNWVVPWLTRASGQPINAGGSATGVTMVGGVTQLDIGSLNTTATASVSDKLPLFSSGTSANRAATIANILAGVAASQTEMESYTSNSVVATPGNMNWHPGVAKAWANFNGSATPGILASYNVSAISRTGTGAYSVVFKTAMSGSSYVVCGIANTPGVTSGTLQNTGSSATGMTLLAVSTTNSAFDGTNIHFTIFGDQ